MVIIMTIANIKEAYEAIKTVEDLTTLRDALKEDKGKRLVLEDGSVMPDVNIRVTDKTKEVLVTMLDAFVTRYEEKFAELGLALDPEPTAPKTDELGKTAWDELED